MDRRALLLDLARAGLLTPARSRLVRIELEHRLRQELVSWELPPFILAAYALAPLPEAEEFTATDVQLLVNSHLAMLGMEPLPLEWCDFWYAEGRSLLYAWVTALREDHQDGMDFHPRRTLLHLPAHVERIARRTDPSWLPLRRLIAAGILPYGPDLGASRFLLVDRRES